jgi:hypothetical protein
MTDISFDIDDVYDAVKFLNLFLYGQTATPIDLHGKAAFCGRV